MNNNAHRLTVYLAAPLFNDMELDFNRALEARLAHHAVVFLPQRDGLLLVDLLKGGMPSCEARRMIFDADISAINDCDVLVALLDGRTVDEGVAFELGYARALGKRCLGLKTDQRSLLLTGDNPMITEGCSEIHPSTDSLVRSLATMARLRLTRMDSSTSD
jgi:nucleoside 2-deoxyribosyltransferase